MAKTYTSAAVFSLTPADASLTAPRKFKGQRWADLSDSDDDDFVPAARERVADILSSADPDTPRSCMGSLSGDSCMNQSAPSAQCDRASFDAAVDCRSTTSTGRASVDAPVDHCAAEDGDRDSVGTDLIKNDNVSEVGTELTDGGSYTASLAPSTASPGSSKGGASTHDEEFLAMLRDQRRRRKTKQREKKITKRITERESRAAEVVAYQLSIADQVGSKGVVAWNIEAPDLLMC